VLKAAYAVYDDARVDLRVANATRELSTFNPQSITELGSAATILDQWSEMAQNNKAQTNQMLALGGVAADLVSADALKMGALRGDIDQALSNVRAGSSLKDFVGNEGAALIKSLSPEEKRALLAGYNTLKEKLSELNGIAATAEARARAFYESSVGRFEAQANFEIPKDQKKFYTGSLKALHEEHIDALKKLRGADFSADDLREVGTQFTEKVRALQETTLNLSKSLKDAAAVEGKLKETLNYLENGVDDNKAVGAADQTVVFISSSAADAIAGWVKAQTKAAEESLQAAKASNDPDAITAATNSLAAASEHVHKQLEDIATLLSKVNGGKSLNDNSPVQSQEARILARVTELRVSDHTTFDNSLSEYVTHLRSEMESRVEKMFSPDADGNYDLERGRKELRIIDKYDDMLESTIEHAKDGGLRPDEVNEAIEKTHARFKEELNPPKISTKTRIDEALEAARADKDRLLNPPKPTLFSRFKETRLGKWLFN